VKSKVFTVFYLTLGKLSSSLERKISEKRLKFASQELLYNKKYCVAIYHNVTSNYSDNTLSINTDIDNFYEQIKLLNKYFNIITFDVLKTLKQENLVKPPLIITFDDIYEGVYSNAYPILKDFGLKAILSLSPFFIEKRKYFWWDVIFDYLKSRPIGESVYKLYENFYYTKYDQRSVFDAFLNIRAHFFNLPPTKIYEILEDNFDYSNYSKADMRASSWEQINEMYKSGFEISNHSYCHSLVSTYSEQKFIEDLKYSEELIINNLGLKPDIYSIPFGHSIAYNKTIEDLLNKAGYQIMLLNQGRANNYPNYSKGLAKVDRISFNDEPCIKLLV